MSRVIGGSTAPPIASPLPQWPSRPFARSSPLSTPSTSIFDDSSIRSLYCSSNSLATTVNFPRSESWTSTFDSGKGKGKARAPEVRVMDEDFFGMHERQYPPPRRPLSPGQLGRIAQSFGIVIPSLPQPGTSISPSSPTSASSSSISRAPRTVNAQTRPTPYLLAVIPPLTLLPPISATSLSDSKDRERRWKRGRLLPLQPTIGSMLLCIAREYGLPSTTGVGLYLVHSAPTIGQDRSSPSPSTSFSSFDEASGPLISPQTWSTLFSGYIHHSAASSRASTPVNTPLKGAGPLGRDIAFPLSPLSLLADPQARSQDRLRSYSTAPTPVRKRSGHSSNPSSSSSLPPLTPTTPNPIVGTIEFDVDPDAAKWLDEWRRSGGASRRKGSVVAEGGVKELKLVKRLREKSRYPREVDTNIQSPTRAREKGYGLGDNEDADSSFISTPDVVFDISDPLSDLFPATAPELALMRASQPVFVERELSVKDIDSGRVLVDPPSHDRFGDGDTSGGEISVPQDVEEVTAVFEPVGGDDLLSSPIALDQEALDAQRRRLAEMDKRGSGLVMSDQLDDLEKLMRQLSPREIRLTSPRLLTPHMAAKVANANLQLPAVPSARPPKTVSSPLASELTSSAPQLAPPLPAWPAAPYIRRPDPPASPSSIEENHPQAHSKSPTVSSETLQRSQTEVSSRTVSTEWKPRRPTRPPSPKLEHARTLSHSLSPELVEQIRSPPQSPADDKDGKPRIRVRSNSISLKGLKSQMSSKNLNTFWRKDEKDRPEMPREASETVGLFKGMVEPKTSTIATLSGQQSPTGTEIAKTSVSEFGATQAISPTTPTTTSLPSRPTQNGFASRILHGSFSFSRKHSDAGHKRKTSISTPVANSFHRIEPGAGSPLSAQEKTPTSPTSPRSVKRKPVPGMTGGTVQSTEGLGQTRGFILEDPPKKRLPMGVAV